LPGESIAAGRRAVSRRRYNGRATRRNVDLTLRREARSSAAACNTWPDLSGDTITEGHGSEVAGTLCGALDVLGDLAEFFVVPDTQGIGLAGCLVVGNELSKAGVILPGLGGLVGITVPAVQVAPKWVAALSSN
jgi:hypothetical protein